MTDAQWKELSSRCAGNLCLMNFGRWEDMHWNTIGFCDLKPLPNRTVCALSRTEIKPSQEYIKCEKCSAFCIKEQLMEYIFEKDPHCIKCGTLWEHPPVLTYLNATEY